MTESQVTSAIEEIYASEPSPGELALQLIAIADAHTIERSAILSWIHDRPRHEMSTAHFLRWCQRYGFDRVYA